jgi:predicted phage tail protein
MMRSVHLHGALALQFGESFRFEVATAAEALRALNCAFPGKFLKAIQGNSYRLVRGNLETGMDLDLELTNRFKLGNADLHLIPVAQGAAMSKTAKGTTKIVLGATLIGGAIFLSGGTLAAPLSVAGLSVPGLTYGTVALMGVGLALAGVSTLLTKPAAQTASNDVSVSGAANAQTGAEGSAIPLVYGETLCPGIVVSVASDSEDIDVYANSAGSIEAAFGHNPSYWAGS